MTKSYAGLVCLLAALLFAIQGACLLAQDKPAKQATAPHDMMTSVEKGDAIYFVTKRVGTREAVTVSWDPVITYID